MTAALRWSSGAVRLGVFRYRADGQVTVTGDHRGLRELSLYVVLTGLQLCDI